MSLVPLRPQGQARSSRQHLQQSVTLQLILEDLCGICAALSAICNVEWHIQRQGAAALPDIYFPQGYTVLGQCPVPPTISNIIFGCRHFFESDALNGSCLENIRINPFDTLLLNASLTDCGEASLNTLLWNVTLYDDLSQRRVHRNLHTPYGGGMREGMALREGAGRGQEHAPLLPWPLGPHACVVPDSV